MICIVEDEKIVRDGLMWLCRSRGLVARDFADGVTFLDACEAGLPVATEPTCVLLDIRMPTISGIELFEVLRQRSISPPATVMFLTGHGDIPMAVQMLKKGAFDFVEKPFSDNDLVDRLTQGEALSGARLLGNSPETAQTDASATLLMSLSPRERQVMDRILQGQLNKVIAAELNVSIRTVELHRARIFEKMGVRSAVQLLRLVGQK